jgi:ComF family protein
MTPYSLDRLISFYRYREIISKMIKEIKYRYSYNMITDIGNYIPRKTLHRFGLINRYNSVIIPIPLHPARYKFRGFNQSEMFAEYLADRMYLPMYTNVLIRTKYTKPQAMIEDRKLRKNNITDAFDIREMCKDTNILLVDDVFTTGATLREACKVLKKAGAKWVCGVTIAR